MIALVTLAVLIPPEDVLGGSVAKQAKKALVAQNATTLNTLKGMLKLGRSFVDGDLDTVDDKLISGAGSIQDVAAVFLALKGYQSSVSVWVDDARTTTNFALVDMHTTLAAASVGNDDLPRGFYLGDGYALDKLQEDVQKLVSKSAKKVEKRVRKTGKLLLEHVGATLNVRLPSPRHFAEATITVASGLYFNPTQLKIDVLLSTSALAETGDGTVYISGTFFGADPDPTLYWFYPEAAAAESRVVTPVEGRWSEAVQGLTEGTSIFKVNHTGLSAGGAHGAIGVH